MKKYIALHASLWFLTEIILTLPALWQNSPLYGLPAIIFGLLPPITCGLNFFIRRKLKVSIQAPVTLSKKKEACVTLIIKNNSLLPVPDLWCHIKLWNRMTNEQTDQWIAAAAIPGKEIRHSFSFSSAHCGYLQIELFELKLMDWFGFLPCRSSCQKKAKISVLPDTFLPQVSLQMGAIATPDAENNDEPRKGNDCTEVFALRDYTPQDSLKQIHWKLSAKQNRLIVKEYSQPVEKNLLLFWDKNTEVAPPEDMDALAESVASVGQALLHQGIPYTLGWSGPSTFAFQEIETEEQLLFVIPKMMKTGAQPLEDLSEYRRLVDGSFSKIIYFATELPTAIEQSPCDITYLLCSDNASLSEPRILTFTAEHYLETLAAIEV